MTDPSQGSPPPRPSIATVAVDARDKSHSSAMTGPRYVMGSGLVLFAMGAFAYHLVTHTDALGVFEQRFIGGLAGIGIAILPPSEAAVRFLWGLIGVWRACKNPQSPQPPQS